MIVGRVLGRVRGRMVSELEDASDALLETTGFIMLDMRIGSRLPAENPFSSFVIGARKVSSDFAAGSPGGSLEKSPLEIDLWKLLFCPGLIIEFMRS